MWCVSYVFSTKTTHAAAGGISSSVDQFSSPQTAHFITASVSKYLNTEGVLDSLSLSAVCLFRKQSLAFWMTEVIQHSFIPPHRLNASYRWQFPLDLKTSGFSLQCDRSQAPQPLINICFVQFCNFSPHSHCADLSRCERQRERKKENMCSEIPFLSITTQFSSSIHTAAVIKSLIKLTLKLPWDPGVGERDDRRHRQPSVSNMLMSRVIGPNRPSVQAEPEKACASAPPQRRHHKIY